MMRSAFFGTAVAVLLGFGAISPVQAYIPPSQFIVNNLVSKHAGPKSVRLRSLVTSYDGEKPTAVHFKLITLVDAASGVIRSHAYDDTGVRLYSIERRLDASEPKVSMVVNHLLFATDKLAVTRILKAAGVTVLTEQELLSFKTEAERTAAETSQLGRFNGQIAWILGDQAELWVEKDTFRPLRLLMKNSGDFADVRFEGYRSYREFPFPKMISLGEPPAEKDKRAHVVGKALILREDVQEVILNADLAEMKAKFVPEFTPEASNVDGAVRDLIKRYFETVR